jgi:hypothetical protein
MRRRVGPQQRVDAARRALAIRGTIAGALLLPAVSGCFTYTRVTGDGAPVGVPVDVTITDAGRVGLKGSLGPGVVGVRGTMAARTDSEYVLSVREVRAIGGSATQWMGDTVSIRRDYVATFAERRFSRRRTLLAVGAVTAAVALAAARSLNVIGGDRGGAGKVPPDPSGT